MRSLLQIKRCLWLLNSEIKEKLSLNMITSAFNPLIIRISLAVRYNEILITCYVYVVRVAVWMPQLVILKWSNKLPTEVPNRNCSISETKEQLILVQKDKCRWSHELQSAYFHQLRTTNLGTKGITKLTWKSL